MINNQYALVITNFLYLLPCFVLVYKQNIAKCNVEISMFLSILIASSTYHLCDAPNINICMQALGSLYLLDVLFSYLAISYSFSPFLSDRYRYFTIVTRNVCCVFKSDHY